MITLYSMPGSCSMATHIALLWSGLPHQVKLVSREDLASPEYRKINPVGAVPAIQDGDWALTQNVAILEYVVEQSKAVNLGAENDAKSRAELCSWLAFLNSDLHKCIGPIFAPAKYVSDESLFDQVRDFGKKRALQFLKLANDRLAGKLHCYGHRKTVADAYLFVILTWFLSIFGCDCFAADYPALNAFYKNMYQDSQVQKAAEEEGVTLPVCA